MLAYAARNPRMCARSSFGRPSRKRPGTVDVMVVQFGFQVIEGLVDIINGLEEFEVDMKAPTADEYVLLVHSERWGELIKFGDQILNVIKEYGVIDDTLIVAHNAVMSAALRILTGEITPFPNLGGFEVEVDKGKIGKPRKI